MLVLVAAPAEADAVAGALSLPSPMRDGVSARGAVGGIGRGGGGGVWVELIRTGVGKVNAALAASAAAGPGASDHALVINLGIAGAMPEAGVFQAERRFRADVLDVVVARSSVYGDEGVQSPDGFRDISDCGFPPGRIGQGEEVFSGVRIDAPAGVVGWAVDALSESGLPVRSGGIATVSTCSGTDALALEVARRTGAIGEGMEGAAIAHALRRCAPGVAMLEVRVISNLTGDRARQAWQLAPALERLGRVAEVLIPRFGGYLVSQGGGRGRGEWSG